MSKKDQKKAKKNDRVKETNPQESGQPKKTKPKTESDAKQESGKKAQSSTSTQASVQSNKKEKTTKIIIYVLIGLVVLMLTCIAAGTLGYILFKRNASEVVAPADSDADGYDIEDTDEEDESTQEDEESEDDTDGTQTDSDTDDESEDSSGDEEVADDETSGDETADDDTSPTTEEWVVEEFSLSVPLTESRYHFVLDVPDFAYSDYQPEGYTVYSYDPQFSLSIITLPEAYGQELTGAQYLFNTSEFGDVYRVEQSDLNPDMYFYSNDVVTEGSCNILGTEVDAPCGATILGDDEGSFFEATCSGASTRGLEYCDEIVRSINLSLE